MLYTAGNYSYYDIIIGRIVFNGAQSKLDCEHLLAVVKIIF